ncbi:MAG: hypothetical protein KDB53_03730 [Planctomycetes bacterium]|nr:hypothetical protein [Planctomycetota bacterium]
MTTNNQMLPVEPRDLPARINAQSGFSILEMMTAIVFLMIASVATLQLSLTTVRLEAQSREVTQATMVVRRVVEDMRASKFDEVFSRFNPDPNDDPAGRWAPGNNFVMRESTQGSEPIEFNVALQFQTNVAGQMSELVPPLIAGMPADLDGDGTLADSGNPPLAIPMVITVQYRSASGELASLRVPLLLSEHANEVNK